jgi:tetratricopeptide (TPR) repeat protein
MSASADKARAQRLQRLEASLEQRLEHPDAAVETLMWELRMGELHPEYWERLHAAAVRDGKEAELTQVYEKVTADHRLKQLTPPERAGLLLHAADFFQGVLGDRAAAEGFLWRLLEQVPDHAEAFARLERRCNATRDRVRLAELYALVATNPPRPPGVHAKAAHDIISLLPSQSPLPDEACRKLFVLLPANQALLGVLETHCRNTGRFGLACALLEESLAGASKIEVIARRRRLIELYIGDAKAPESAISHVETLLEQDPSDAQVRAAAERLVRIPEVASRAAAALQAARRHLRERA